jgi:outer membrane lipoprotein-sorting protein
METQNNEQPDPGDELLEVATERMRSRFAEVNDPPQWLQHRTAHALRSAAARRPRRRVALVALVAAVLLLAAIGVISSVLLRSESMAYADVVRQVEKSQTLQARVIQYDERGEKQQSTATISIKGPRSRLAFDGGDRPTNIADRQSGESVQLNLAGRSAIRFHNASDAFDFAAWLRDVRNGSVQRLGEKTIAGQRLIGFAGVFERRLKDGSIERGFPFHVWVDPQTRLPVRLEQFDEKGVRRSELVDIHFDIPLDDALFDVTPPAGFYVHDMGGLREDQVRPPATTREAEHLTLHLGQGIADVKFGATRDQIVRELGEPEFTASDLRPGFTRLEYPSRGMSIFLGPEEGLRKISVFDVNRRGINGHTFPGKTERGIAIGSSAADLQAAYGPPDRDGRDTSSGLVHVFEQYRRLGLSVSLGHGRVTDLFLTPTGGMGIAIPLSEEQRRKAQAMVLRPGVGVDDVKLGTRRDEVIALLGKPHDDQYDLQYPALGLSLNFDKGGKLKEIYGTIPNRLDNDGNPFAGQTDRGIRIGSTRAQIEQAYGKPDEIEQPTTQQATRFDPQFVPMSLIYRRAGIEFNLEGDRVVSICVRPSAARD